MATLISPTDAPRQPPATSLPTSLDPPSSPFSPPQPLPQTTASPSRTRRHQATELASPGQNEGADPGSASTPAPKRSRLSAPHELSSAGQTPVSGAGGEVSQRPRVSKRKNAANWGSSGDMLLLNDMQEERVAQGKAPCQTVGEFREMVEEFNRRRGHDPQKRRYAPRTEQSLHRAWKKSLLPRKRAAEDGDDDGAVDADRCAQFPDLHSKAIMRRWRDTQHSLGIRVPDTDADTKTLHADAGAPSQGATGQAVKAEDALQDADADDEDGGDDLGEGAEDDSPSSSLSLPDESMAATAETGAAPLLPGRTSPFGASASSAASHPPASSSGPLSNGQRGADAAAGAAAPHSSQRYGTLEELMSRPSPLHLRDAIVFRRQSKSQRALTSKPGSGKRGRPARSAEEKSAEAARAPVAPEPRQRDEHAAAAAVDRERTERERRWEERREEERREDRQWFEQALAMMRQTNLLITALVRQAGIALPSSPIASIDGGNAFMSASTLQPPRSSLPFSSGH